MNLNKVIKYFIATFTILLILVTIGYVIYDKLSVPKANCYAAIATDIHYLALENDMSDTEYEAILESNDGKILERSEELTDEFIRAVINQNPEILILTGDISFNGDERDHMAIADKLRSIEEAGIDVIVTPGNHDITPDFNGEQFMDTYKDFGYSQALAKDKSSLSYVYQASDTLRILMIDSNTESECNISDETLAWIRTQFVDAKENHMAVWAAGHQIIYDTIMFADGFTIVQAKELRALFEEYGVHLYLSGHTHMQHIHKENGVTEITTSALSVTPLQFGILASEGRRVKYHTLSA
ncbi:MAG: metallophosphoesterase, partial [Firmicutes bacterium]|nr:metallophosphoesterase [Bacillota bacterium]